MHELAFHYVPGYMRQGTPPPARATPPRPETPADQLPDTKEYAYEALHTEIYEAFKEYCESLDNTEVSVQGMRYLYERGFTDYTLRLSLIHI